ncbi:MAG: hypothetical protein HOE90_06445 [Bacteriovoracaceae bacterium]|jgi:hypothetical protein|nr:hypothetical protein [Bacteriovoracaceae bacterium]
MKYLFVALLFGLFTFSINCFSSASLEQMVCSRGDYKTYIILDRGEQMDLCLGSTRLKQKKL